MFYNFNRHKEKSSTRRAERASSASNKMQAHHPKFPIRIAHVLARFRHKGRTSILKMLFTCLLAAGGLYSIYLTCSAILGVDPCIKLDFAFRKIISPANPNIIAPSNKQKALDAYLDSLQSAWIKDSIENAQLNHQSNADTNLLP